MLKNLVLSEEQETRIEQEVNEGRDYFVKVEKPTYDTAEKILPRVEDLFREWNLRLAVYGL